MFHTSFNKRSAIEAPVDRANKENSIQITAATEFGAKKTVFMYLSAFRYKSK